MTRSRKTRATPNPRARSHPSADVRHPPSSFCSRPPLHSALHHRGPAALLRDRTLSITLLLAALPFACLPDTDIREDTISDPQGCRTIHIIDDTTTGTESDAATSTSTPGTDPDTITPEAVCGNGMIEADEQCDHGSDNGDDNLCSDLPDVGLTPSDAERANYASVFATPDLREEHTFSLVLPISWRRLPTPPPQAKSDGVHGLAVFSANTSGSPPILVRAGVLEPEQPATLAHQFEASPRHV